jgi:hypothetical protein
MKKTLNYLYYFAFIIVFLVLIDTILTSDQESFSILSISTNKAINILIYCLVLLLFTHLIIKTKKNEKWNWWIAVFDKYRIKLNKWRWWSSSRFLRIWIHLWNTIDCGLYKFTFYRYGLSFNFETYITIIVNDLFLILNNGKK